MSINDPDFTTWQQSNLINFAKDAYEKLQRQDDEIQHLKLDLKTAINAYRQLLEKLG